MSTWTPLRQRRLTDFSSETTDKGILQRAIYALLTGPKHQTPGGLPTSSRFIFYELVQADVIDKSIPDRKRTPAQDVSDALMHLRRANLVPWEWIKDETRSLTTWRSATTAYKYIADDLDTLRLDFWTLNRKRPPLILTESRSLAGVLENIAGEYLCPIAATNGQVGGFLYTDIIPILEEGDRVFYFGDYDNQGADIESNTRDAIEAEVGDLEWERLALTAGQVAQYRIPSKPKTDKRFTANEDGGQSLAYETEALSQTVIQGILRDALDLLLANFADATTIEDIRVRDDEARGKARRRLRAGGAS